MVDLAREEIEAAMRRVQVDARLAERERCALIAERAFVTIGGGHPYDQGLKEGCRRAAAAIRRLKD